MATPNPHAEFDSMRGLERAVRAHLGLAIDTAAVSVTPCEKPHQYRLLIEGQQADRAVCFFVRMGGPLDPPFQNFTGTNPDVSTFAARRGFDERGIYSCQQLGEVAAWLVSSAKPTPTA